MSEPSRSSILWKVLLWAGRVMAVLVFLLWGAFFVEHLQEWFISPHPQTPPPKIWFGQFLHGLMLVFLLISLRWPVPGTILVAISAIAFFGPRAGNRAPEFIMLTVFPALLLLLCWWHDRKPAGVQTA